MNENVGQVAGQVWMYLNEHGPSTTIKLKSHLEVSNTLLCLSLGWLAREEKINIVKAGHTYEVSLR